MDRSVKAVIFLALLMCFLRVVFHAGEAIYPVPSGSVTDGHIEDAGGYVILAVIFCYVAYRFPKKK